ncbi:multiple epidermal growth factor-like domains protein 11 [Pomacea canaliculata]|uniref:multiple epidermal growth factor-like domains protein 11 n=1 Tax=Pomacea canaliculata TaxID=400727 RepID=UPI000D726564|nr:multiple epidermal growth factor-like domains protein 11 [Pomacea canaliculata]
MAGRNFWLGLLFVIALWPSLLYGEHSRRPENSVAGSVCPSGFYGNNCRHRCHCKTNDTACVDVTGYCTNGCIDRWSGPTCQSENVAFRMPSKIRTVTPPTSADYAVDGNVSTCAHSTPNSTGWFQVDLQTTVTVYRIYLVTENLTSTRGWKVFVTDYEDFFWAAPCTTIRLRGSHVHLTCDSPVTGKYLALLNTKGPLAVCEVQVNVCANYSFGVDCELICRCADSKEVCHPLTGHCITGCEAGHRGRDCQSVCVNSYGRNCATPCGHCAGGQSCDPVNGRCTGGGCEAGWTGDNCNISCPRGYYGHACNKRCGHCHDEDPCAPDNGLCPGLCQAGWTGPQCDQRCRQGFYGPSCLFSCGHCLTGTACDTNSGICLQGCTPGWEGLFCTQECLPHHHGPNCLQTCPRCVTSCNSQTGVCDGDGCVAGFRGQECEKECDKGFYGVNCNESCGLCARQPCDVVTGDCPPGDCQPGWRGPSCKTPCTPGMFGENCSRVCGGCKDRAACHPETGVCPGSCADGYYGELCADKNIFTNAASQTFVVLLATILTITATLLVGVFVCLALKWRRDKDPHNAYDPQELDARLPAALPSQLITRRWVLFNCSNNV